MLDLLDVQKQPQHGHQDKNERQPQTLAPVISFDQGRLTCLQILGGNLQPFPDVLLYQSCSKAVDGDPRFRLITISSPRTCTR